MGWQQYNGRDVQIGYYSTLTRFIGFPKAHQLVMAPATQTTEELLALKKKRTFRKFTYR